MSQLLFRIFLTAFTVTVLSNCALVNTALETDPAMRHPENWESDQANGKIITGWLSQFNDRQLNTHVRTALQNNFNLKVDLEQLNAAIANARATNADLFPDVNLGIQGSRSKNFIINDRGDAIAQYSTQYQGDIGITWEVDLWNKLSDSSRAAALDSEVLAASYQAARLSLAASVAQTWFNTIEARNQLELAQRQLKSLGEALDIVENNYRAGLTSAVDVFTAKSDLENQKALLAQSNQTLEQLKRNFNRLLGRYPSARLDTSEAKIPDSIDTVPSGLPSELLLRRPDVIAAYKNWLARQYDQGNARKNRYPSFKLTGTAGQGSDTLSKVLDSDDLFWSLVAGISQPVFDAGRLKALEQSAAAQTRQALAEYANTILNAFNEVENAFAGEQYLLDQYKTTKSAAELAKTAYDISLEQYQRGLVEYVTVLANQRQYFSADSRQLGLYNDLIQNRIDLHLALGGDFFTLTEL